MNESPRLNPSRWGTTAFLAAFALYFAVSLLWLALGLVPPLASTVPAFRHGLELLAGGSGPFEEVSRRLLLHGSAQPGAWVALQYAFSALNVALGVLLALRRPSDLVPRLLSVAFIGTGATFNAPSHELFHAIGDVPVVTGAHFLFHIVSGVAYLWAVLLFPDGRLPLAVATHRRWGTLTVALTSTAVITFVCYESSFVAHPPFFVAFFGILVPAVGMTAQGLRLRVGRQPPRARQQSRLLRLALTPALAAAGLWLSGQVVARTVDSWAGAAGTLMFAVENAFPAAFAVVPVVLFVAILRYRLWDIDVAISRAFVFALLAGFVAVLYVAVIGATGWLFRGGGWPAVIALTVVGLAAEPARERFRAVVNRLVFGQILTPREAMRALANRLAQPAPAEELSELATVIVSGTRCASAEVWVLVEDHLLLMAAYPAPRAERTRRLPLPVATPEGCHTATGADVCVPVTHEGRLLAVLALTLPAGVALPAAQDRLIRDVAGHAGMLVANARLTEDLSRQVEVVTAQAEELARSRLRVVAAQDAERRRLERNIHDGAQQELVAVLVQLRALQRAAAAGREVPGAQVAELRQAVAATRSTIRQLSTGDPPAVLAEAGLPAALEAAVAPARRSGLDVRLACALEGRLPDEVESTVYFCCLEALQNATKHARAERVEVRVEPDGDEVVFSVSDDGTGFDPARAKAGSGLANLVDRLAVLGGTVRVESASGMGTRLCCRLPLARERTGTGS